MEIEHGASRNNDSRGITTGSQRSASSRKAQDHNGHSATGAAQRSAAAAGWLSVGIGVAGLVAPRQIARTLGAHDHSGAHWLVRALALHELVSGTGILLDPRRSRWHWWMLAGDAVGLTLLGAGLTSGKVTKARGLAATAAMAVMMSVEGMTALKLRRQPSDGHTRGFYVTSSLTINLPPERVYSYWRDLSNLPRFMTHLASVEMHGVYTHFRAQLPAGVTLEWDTELTDDRPNERIQWRSLPGADLENHGMVRFLPAPGGRGTEVHVMLSYLPPAGALGVAFAKLFGKLPAQQLHADLRRLKQLLETGDRVHSDASIHRGPHPAQPSARSQEVRSENASSEVNQ